MDRLRVAISGSFRKHFEGIKSKIAEFESLGVEVLSPKSSAIVNPNEQFAILATDQTNDPKQLEENHLLAIKESDFLYVFNPDGYIGLSTAMEMGYAKALGKPIISKEEPQDVTLKCFVHNSGW